MALNSTQHNGCDSLTCSDCGRWAYVGQALVHSKRCDSPEQAPIDPKALRTKGQRRAAAKVQDQCAAVRRLGYAGMRAAAREGVGLTDDELVELHLADLISGSEAMSRDD